MTTNSGLRVAVCAASFASIMIVSPASARTVEVNQANIVKSLAAAQPGDKLVLAAGGYGAIALPRKTWQTPITIDARAASLTGLVMFQVSGVNWVGGTILNAHYGVNIRWAQRINLSNVVIKGGVRGIVINDSSDLKILRNKLSGIQTDAIDVVGQRILVEANNISDMRPAVGDHPDAIQLWSANNEQTTDIVIRGNTIYGRSQGIFGNARTLGMKNITITGNNVTVAYGNGIVMSDLTNSVATGNTVKSTPDRINRANMRIDGATNKACDNVVVDVPYVAAAKPCPA